MIPESIAMETVKFLPLAFLLGATALKLNPQPLLFEFAAPFRFKLQALLLNPAALLLNPQALLLHFSQPLLLGTPSGIILNNDHPVRPGGHWGAIINYHKRSARPQACSKRRKSCIQQHFKMTGAKIHFHGYRPQ
jgi:hypothetical protein